MKKKKTYVSPEAKYWSAEELNEIEAKMSGGSGGTATGSSFFPYQLTDGEAHTTNIRKYWFKCRTRGATDVSIVTSKPATIKIYKSKWFSDKLIKSVTNKNSLKLHLWDYNYDGLNSYRIYVSFPTGSGEVTCFVGCHTDVATYHEGALWVPKSDSAWPLSNIKMKKNGILIKRV